MNFRKKQIARFTLVSAALFLAGCAAGAETASSASSGVPAKAESASVAGTPAAAPETLPPVVFSAPAEIDPEEAEKELKTLAEETEKLKIEKNLIEARLALLASENDRTLAPIVLEKAQLDAGSADSAARLAEEIAGIEEERTEFERRLALENARANAAISEKQLRRKNLELETRELQAEMNGEALRVNFAVSAAESRDQLSKLAPAAAQSPKYLKEPFVDGTLYISDRRIPLNGPITEELAKTVCDQIYFYNNKNSEYPIFIVIDNSPGGSVAAGYQIQKAMQSSKAPVYVVVRGFAASMAAVITTMAERSFCFGNALILHHQISSEVKGNLTVMREGVAEGGLWYERFAGPVAKKMGISLEEFTKLMYQHNSDGDWMESGDRAVELKWADHVVNRIEETGIVAIDASASASPSAPAGQRSLSEEKTDAQGKRFVELPALSNPFDFWAIYDKNNYYRAR